MPHPSTGPDLVAAAKPAPWHRRRWVLLLQNAVVANALSLQLGYGGLRTPSSVANLLLTALLMGLPLFHVASPYWVACWRSVHRHAKRHHGDDITSWLFASSITLLVALAALCFVLLFGFAVMLHLPRLPKPPLWLPLGLQGALVVVLLPTLHTSRDRAGAILQRLVRCLAWLPPCGLLAALGFLTLVRPGMWLGRDPMWKPIAHVDHGWGRYEAIQNYQPDLHLHLMSVTPIVPWMLGWWHGLHTERRASTIDLRIEAGDVLVAVFDPQQPEPPTIRIPLR